MTFNQTEIDLIELGKLTIMRSLKEMKIEGDDLNVIDYDSLIDKCMRNIVDKSLLEAIQQANDERDKGDFHGSEFEWRDELK